MNKASVVSLVKLDMPGGGALAVELMRGLLPGVSFEYHGLPDEGDVGVVGDFMEPDCL